jgi:hypothetical protein
VLEIPRRDLADDSSCGKVLSHQLGTNGRAISDGSVIPSLPSDKPLTVNPAGRSIPRSSWFQIASYRFGCAQPGYGKSERGLDSVSGSPKGDPRTRASGIRRPEGAERVAVAGRSLWRTISCTSGKVTKQTGITAGRASKSGGRL